MRSENRIKPFLKYIEKEWMKNPDMRFGQLLINLGLIEDGGEWNKEMEDYPLPFEVRREIEVWGRYKGDVYVKGIGLMPVYDKIPIKDLELSHIKSILKTQKHIKGKRIEKLLKQELKYRKSNKHQPVKRKRSPGT